MCKKGLLVFRDGDDTIWMVVPWELFEELKAYKPKKSNGDLDDFAWIEQVNKLTYDPEKDDVPEDIQRFTTQDFCLEDVVLDDIRGIFTLPML